MRETIASSGEFDFANVSGEAGRDSIAGSTAASDVPTASAAAGNDRTGDYKRLFVAADFNDDDNTPTLSDGEMHLNFAFYLCTWLNRILFLLLHF